MAITGHLEDNKPTMNTLPWALADEWKGEVHTDDFKQLKGKVFISRHNTVLWGKIFLY